MILGKPWIVANNGLDIHTADVNYKKVATCANEEYAKIITEALYHLNAIVECYHAGVIKVDHKFVQAEVFIQGIADAHELIKKAIQ